MGTDIESKMTSHSLKEFWGGNHRGVCLQVTAARDVDGEGFIQLTMEEAALLCSSLGLFVRVEATRRQNLLRASLEQLKLAERTVFHEVAELPTELMTGPELAVKMVSQFCPKHR